MNVLIVDDDIATVDAVTNLINWQKMGINSVFRAYNIQQARNQLKEKKIDILICDIEMPMGTGIDLLQWVREKNLNGEFIFLTCHDSFDFALKAIEYGAVGYILKPCNSDSIEIELNKAINKLNSSRKAEHEFWRNIVLSPYPVNPESVKAEILQNKIYIDIENRFFFVMVCANPLVGSEKESGSELLEFGMTKMTGEVLIGDSGSERVISYSRDRTFYIVVLFNEVHSLEDVRTDCMELIGRIESTFQISINCYISQFVTLATLKDKRKLLEKINYDNVIYRGRVFLEGDFDLNVNENDQYFDMELIKQYLTKQNKIELLKMIKGRLELLASRRKLNVPVLQRIQQDLLQTVYVYLYDNDIQGTELFSDDKMNKLQQNASSSYIDMMQFLTYLINRTFEIVNSITDQSSLVDSAKKFICRNYNERITRNEVAEKLHMNPEYLARLFKKEEGISIKNYINNYRIEKAKSMLLDKNNRISDIALDLGFGNIPYFTTKFKEIVGISPSEYRKWHVIS